MRVSEVMKSEVVSVLHDATVVELATLLEEKKVSGVPVVDHDGRLLGVISRTDLGLGLSRPPMTSEHDRPTDSYYEEDNSLQGLAHTKVADLMTTSVVSIEPHEELDTLIDMMISEKIHRVFVTQSEEVVGVVSASDLLPVLQRLMSSETVSS